MHIEKETFPRLTLSPYEAGVLKHVLNCVEIDDEKDVEDAHKAEDVINELFNALAPSREIEVPLRFIDVEP